MRSCIVYWCDRRKAPIYQTTVSEHNAWVGWDIGESQHKCFVRTETSQQNCSISQDAHRNLHIFQKNKHYCIFSQDRQIVKIFLAVFRWHVKWMFWLCYTRLVFSVTKISVTNIQRKWSSSHNSFSLSEPKYLAHMNIELRHCTVFQVLQENCAVDILWAPKRLSAVNKHNKWSV